ncbi:hypothetical protein [Lysobacter sp. CFH 32150]|uniref:hypothetical protein n=1 Tax=Lysobacter sp. CFH 32150 TaxID=2927128 RepID=UPI001FA7A23E|nr:hypothetical protein [Lysobacter sp. CFH 32150]MCI4567879.1 hypothetical protein [Lysobacter sp. CFH 32150]
MDTHTGITAMPGRKGNTASAIALGGVAVGTLDAIFATIFWGLRDVPAIRIFQSIAAGLLGKTSFNGGIATAWLGAGLHYFIATTMVLAYYLVAKRYRVLSQRPIAYGLAYGLFLYVFMQYVVVPLSAATQGKFHLDWVASSIVVHALLGVICAWFARRALRRD